MYAPSFITQAETKVENLREQISRIEEDLEQAEAKKVDFQQQTEDNEKNYEEARR